MSSAGRPVRSRWYLESTVRKSPRAWCQSAHRWSSTANDGLDFGIDLGSPVGIEYYDEAPFKFNGKIEGARVEYLGSPAQLQEEKLQTDGPIPVAD
jgi:hypothetical protein